MLKARLWIVAGCFAATLGCKQAATTGESQFSAAPHTAGAVELYTSLSKAQQQPDTTQAQRLVRAKPLAQVMQLFSEQLTDAPVTIGGKSYQGLRTALVANKAGQEQLKNLSAVFPTTADFLAANGGSSGPVTASDVDAFLDIGQRGLVGLTTHARMTTDGDRSKVLQAWKVAVLVAAMNLSQAPAELSLKARDGSSPATSPTTPGVTPKPTPTLPDNTKTYPQVGVNCPHFDAHAKGGCLKDQAPNALGPAIGFYTSNVDDSNDTKKWWQDAYMPHTHNDHAYPVCAPEQVKADSDWGWIPSSDGKSGVSCHK